ncbi:phage tail length tape measure family protein [Neorhizobium alkalisoli]|uniref:Uncharacterized protein (TIGR02594 family) n=1 Tax=Neorhizobium alkalisoli TaxID=528178 RepID=A0A561PVR1_9HYPH|nr:phage tail length tape measure family protein [Neorhizobium alkalisoli]TWF42201.1 uncharacterized protein (TIGR02594 family) [Neorhizobium alkalisoli]
MSDNMTDDLIISISTDQATLRRSIKRIEQDLGTLAGTVKNQFDGVGKSIDNSLTTSLQSRINGMVGIGTSAAKEWTGALADQGKELERLRARYSPLFNTINNYKSAVSDIRRAHALGAISSDEMAKAIAKERQAALASTAAIKGRNAALAQTPATRQSANGGNGYTANIAAQFQDIGVTAAMGMSPLQIALQQGTQLSAVLNEMQNPVKGLAAAFMSVVSPVSLVTIGVVAAGAAAIQYFGGLTSDATDAGNVLKDHAALIARIKGAYGEAAEGLNDYARESPKIVRQDTVDKIEEYRKAVLGVAKDLREGLKLDPRDFGGATFTISEVVNAVKMLDAGIKSGKPDLQAFVEKLIEIENQSGTPANIRKILSELRETAKTGVEAQRALQPLISTVEGVGAAAAAQAKQVAAFSKALAELADIAKPALSDAEQAGAAFQKAMSNAVGSEDRAAAVAQYDAARKRIDDQNPTVINSDGNRTAVPLPGQKPVTLGDKSDAETKKAETAAERAANAYRDLKKSADDRIGQMRQEIELLGKFGIEADTARFALDLLQSSEDKGRSLSPSQRKEIEQKIELYRQYSEQLAKTKLAQDLASQMRFNSLPQQDQQVVTTLRQYGLPEDLNSEQAGQIRQSLKLEENREGLRSFFGDFKSALINNGGDIGKALGESIQNALLNSASKLWDKIFDQLINSILGTPSGGSAGGGGVGAAGGVLANVFGASKGGGAVDVAGKLLGANENTSTSQINSFLKAGGVDINAAQTAWCAAFVNSSLAQVGIKGSGSLTANSFQNWGSKIDPSQVLKGDVLLKTRGLAADQAGGHVGLATGSTRMQNGSLQLQMLSGNSSDAVGTSWVNATELQVKRATEAAGALGDVAKSATSSASSLGQLGSRLSSSFFPAAPSAPSGGGGLGWLGSIFGGGLTSAQIAKYTPMVGLFADGGPVYGPGTGTSDSIPTMLSNEEFVINAKQSKKHRALLHAINNGTLGHMARGGVVGTISAPVAPALSSRRGSANDNRQPGVLVVRIDGANGDDHVRAIVRQGVNEGLGQYNQSQQRSGFGSIQQKFTSMKG